MHLSVPGANARVRIGIILLLAVVVGLLCFSIPNQRVHIDEGWLGEQAYWQATNGVRRSELFRGFLGYEDYIFVAHKLFIGLGALTVNLLGWHLWSLRLIPLLFGAVLVVLIWIYFRLSRDDVPSLALPIALLYLLAAPLFFQFVNLYRPEVPLAACGFASFLLLALHLTSGRWLTLILAAVVAGIGFLMHLNGVIYIGAGALTLMWVREWRQAVAFVAVAAAVAALYFYDVLGHWDVFWYQFATDPALDKQDFAWYSPAWRLINEHKRLFRKPEVIFASLMLFASLIYYWKTMPRHKWWLAIYMIAMLVGLGAFAQGKTTTYTILLLPIAAVLVGVVTSHWLERIHRYPRWISVVACALWVMFLGHSLMQNAVFAFAQKRDVATTNKETARLIPPGATVLAPLDFVFEEIGNYKIRGDEAAGWIMKLVRPDIGDIHKALHAPDYLRFAVEHDLDAVIMPEHLFTRVGMEVPHVGDTTMRYRAVGRVDELERTVFLREE